jgi:hypothetical protein
VLQVPQANGSFAAFIFFSLLGIPHAPGSALPTLLSSETQAAPGSAVAPTSGNHRAEASKKRSGALGAAVRRLAGAGEATGSRLWWVYLGLAFLLSALAVLGLVAFRRRHLPSVG